MSWQDWFWNLLAAEWSIADIADGYGLSERQVWGQLGTAASFQTPRQRPRSG